MLSDCATAYGLRSISLRYFNACGADGRDAELGQQPGATHLIARLLEARRDGTTFVLNGEDYDTPDGTCIRDFIHVDDLADAHWAAIAYLLAGGATTQVNLGSGQGHSTREVISAVEARLGAVDIVAGPRRPGDPDQLVADISLAHQLLDWQPRNSDLGNIIDTSWAWYNRPTELIDSPSK